METFSSLLALWEDSWLVTGVFPSQKANNAELWCFLYSQSEQKVEQTVELPVIWDVMTLKSHHRNDHKDTWYPTYEGHVWSVFVQNLICIARLSFQCFMWCYIILDDDIKDIRISFCYKTYWELCGFMKYEEKLLIYQKWNSLILTVLKKRYMCAHILCPYSFLLV